MVDNECHGTELSADCRHGILLHEKGNKSNLALLASLAVFTLSIYLPQPTFIFATNEVNHNDTTDTT